MVTLVFFWCSTVSAESTLPPCQGDDHMQWTNCLGTYLKKDVKPTGWTRDYTGEFGSIPGKREGKGSSKTYEDGSLYATYIGEFKDDKLNGQVNIIYADGASYVGGFKENKRHGQGTYTWPDGDKFVGEYKDGKRNGQGTFTSPDGDKFVGEYKDGKKNGQGTHTWPDGEKLVGEYKDGKENGQGTHTWPSGQKFVGEYKDGKRNGQGTYTWPDGEKLVGEYKDGKINGQGTHTWPDGDKEVALYKDGEIVKIISSTIKKESSSTSSFSSSLSGYKHCKSVWSKLINIRDRYSKNSSNYYRLDALVQTAFDLWTAYKGTNATDTGNCDRLLSLGKN